MIIGMGGVLGLGYGCHKAGWVKIDGVGSKQLLGCLGVGLVGSGTGILTAMRFELSDGDLG